MSLHPASRQTLMAGPDLAIQHRSQSQPIGIDHLVRACQSRVTASAGYEFGVSRPSGFLATPSTAPSWPRRPRT